MFTPEQFDEWWPRVRTVVGAVVGFGVIVFETVFDHADRPWLYAAALAATGIPLSRTAEQVLGKFISKENSYPEEGEQPHAAKPPAVKTTSSRPPKNRAGRSSPPPPRRRKPRE